MSRRPKPTAATRLLGVLAAAALAGTVSAGDVGPWSLLFATSYHGDEIAAVDGETYLAVVRDGDGWRMVATPVRVRRVEDPILDPPGEKTGKEVRVEGAAPLFLVRGNLEPGPVETLVSQHGSLFGSPRFGLTLANGRQYQLTVDCPDAPEPSPEARERNEFPAAWSEPCPLRLRHGTRVQLLAELAVNRLHDSGASFLWAGDLDRDGRLDRWSTSPLTTTRVSRRSFSPRPRPPASSWRRWHSSRPSAAEPSSPRAEGGTASFPSCF